MCPEVEVDRAAFGVEAGRHGDTFHERRLPAAVLADEDRHPGIQGKRVYIAEGRQVERISALF